ncbi:MAG: hypothetical protein ACK527_07595 [Acidobacteriota bacterium]|jgi:hypothetical protein
MGLTEHLGRRELLLALASGRAVQGQTVQVTPWQAVAEVYGVQVAAERWAVLGPVLDRRRANVEALRRFRVDEEVAPLGDFTI